LEFKDNNKEQLCICVGGDWYRVHDITLTNKMSIFE